jgi:hypothetical protein
MKTTLGFLFTPREEAAPVTHRRGGTSYLELLERHVSVLRPLERRQGVCNARRPRCQVSHQLLPPYGAQSRLQRTREAKE